MHYCAYIGKSIRSKFSERGTVPAPGRLFRGTLARVQRRSSDAESGVQLRIRLPMGTGAVRPVSPMPRARGDTCSNRYRWGKAWGSGSATLARDLLARETEAALDPLIALHGLREVGLVEVRPHHGQKR